VKIYWFLLWIHDFRIKIPMHPLWKFITFVPWIRLISDQAQKILWYRINRSIFNFSGPESIVKGSKSALASFALIVEVYFVLFFRVSLFYRECKSYDACPNVACCLFSCLLFPWHQTRHFVIDNSPSYDKYMCYCNDKKTC